MTPARFDSIFDVSDPSIDDEMDDDEIEEHDRYGWGSTTNFDGILE